MTEISRKAHESIHAPDANNNLLSIAEREWFFVRDTMLDKDWTAMIVSSNLPSSSNGCFDNPVMLLLVDHTMNGNILSTIAYDPRHQMRWNFIRYLNTSETVSFQGSDPAPDPASALDEIYFSHGVNEESLKISHDLELIPDFIPYMAKLDGNLRQCINHPGIPGGSSSLEKRHMCVESGGRCGINPLKDRTRCRWKFVGFPSYKDLLEPIKELIQGKI